MLNAFKYLEPSEVVIKIFRCHTIKTLYPSFQSTVVTVDVLDMIKTFLLCLPFAHEGDIEWIDALFFAVSATTVTGLGVSDTASTFTLFGEIVLMVLIEFGGIGLMTFSVAILVLMKMRCLLLNDLKRFMRVKFN